MARRHRCQSRAAAKRSDWTTGSERTARTGSRSANVYRSDGHRAASVASDHGSSVMFRRTASTAAVGLPKLYGGGRLFACRHCYRLGYAVQRGGPMDRAHHNLGRLHRKLRANYDGPTCRHHRSRSGCAGRHIPGSPSRSMPARSGWMWYSISEHSGSSAGSISRNSPGETGDGCSACDA